MYDRIAAWARRDDQSLNAMAVELLECALDAYDGVEAEDTQARAK